MSETFNIKDYNSLGVDACADRMICFDSFDNLRQQLAADPTITSEKFMVLGAGNNVLFTGDYHGTLIHPVSRGIEVESRWGDEVCVRVAAGEMWDDFVAWAVDNDLWGVENLSAIPSSVGASPVQNIGAYGSEAKDVIRSVEMLAVENLSKVTLSAQYCDFGYRKSVFKNSLSNKVIVTSVLFVLSRRPNPRLEYGALRSEVEKLGEPTLSNIRKAVVAIRSSKLPDPKVTGNAGSFFKNPVVDCSVAESLLAAYPSMPTYPSHEADKVKLAAGWLIEQAGWKGAVRGRAGVHPKQALVLVNLGGATGSEIIDLARAIADDVERKFGIGIEPEVVVV